MSLFGPAPSPNKYCDLLKSWSCRSGIPVSLPVCCCSTVGVKLGFRRVLFGICDFCDLSCQCVGWLCFVLGVWVYGLRCLHALRSWVGLCCEELPMYWIVGVFQCFARLVEACLPCVSREMSKSPLSDASAHDLSLLRPPVSTTMHFQSAAQIMRQIGPLRSCIRLSPGWPLPKAFKESETEGNCRCI